MSCVHSRRNKTKVLSAFGHLNDMSDGKFSWSKGVKDLIQGFNVQIITL